MDEKNINIGDQQPESVNPIAEAPKENETETVALEEPMTVTETGVEVTEDSKTEPTPIAPPPIYRWEYREQERYDRSHSKKRNPKQRGGFVYALIFAFVFLCTILLLVGSIFLGEMFGSKQEDDTVLYGSIGDLYEECLPSYVAISVKTGSGEGVGSGIIITSDGYIATNYHVVEDAVAITAILNDGTTYDAKFIDGDELNDIAVIKVEAKELPAAKIGSSKNSRVGDQVMAIGTPHSINYQGTMTSGYISALDRRFVEENANGTVKKVLYLIQTDTSVNPGNSGGPLFNMAGEVIGIVTLKISGDNYEGLGFALPMESVIDMINDIIENGEITDPNAGGANQGAALGITGYVVTKDTKYLLCGDYHYRMSQDQETGEELVLIPTIYGDIEVPLSDKESLAVYDITEDYTFYTAPETGFCVVGTTDGFDSAEKLKINDIIVTADGVPCLQKSTLQSLIADKRIGDTLEFEVFRDGKLITVTVELGKSASME